MGTEETAEQRRSKIMSLSSGATPAHANVPELTVGDTESEAAGRAVLQELLSKETLDDLEAAGKYSKAHWKLQIWFKSDRSIHKPITFTLTFWESGKRLHGGGDESAFICRRNPNAPKPVRPPFLALGKSPFPKEASVDGCNTIIPGDQAVNGYVICPGCGVRWDTEHIADSLYYVLPVEVASTVIAEWFRKLDSDCDLYLKYRPEDVRAKMMAQTYGLAEAIRNKGLLIYPLRNIMRELAAGATLESRIKAVMLA